MATKAPKKTNLTALLKTRAPFGGRGARSTRGRLRRFPSPTCLRERRPQRTSGKREPNQAVPRRLLPDAERLFGVDGDEAGQVIRDVDVADLRVRAEPVVCQLF